MSNGFGRGGGGHHGGGGGGGGGHHGGGGGGGGGHHGGGGRHHGGGGMPWNYSFGPGPAWGYGPSWWEPTSYEYILEEEDDPLAPRKRVVVQKTGLLGTGDTIDATAGIVASWHWASPLLRCGF